MKKITLLTIFFFSVFVFSQEEQTKNRRAVSPDHGFSVYLSKHGNFGENYLSKAHQSIIGFGTHKNFINVYGFALGVEYEFNKYKITDKSLAGNIKYTNYSNLSFRLSYDYKLNEDFTLDPYIRIGGTQLRQRSSGRNFGRFEGTSYYLGVNLKYKLENNVHLFTGINYNYTSYQVNSNPEYQSFFDRSNQIQIHLGIGFF